MTTVSNWAPGGFIIAIGRLVSLVRLVGDRIVTRIDIELHPPVIQSAAITDRLVLVTRMDVTRVKGVTYSKSEV